MSDGFTVAIDGPAAAGKGTVSKAVAAHFGFAHLDTGLLYRAVGAKVLASKVAVIAEVRAALLDFQRSFAARAGGVVLDGRDIGTVICPDAQVKLFVTASAEVRAQRRYTELSGRGILDSYETVLADVKARDARDMERVEAPLMPASDASVIDTSELSIEQAVAAAICAVDAVRRTG